MQNAQNTNSNFTVENLVAKYREYVGEHCPQLSEGCGLVPYKDDAEEQLLITLYKQIAGKEADKRIVKSLSEYANDFYADALNKSEMSFLAEHFSECSALVFEYFASHSKRRYDHYVLSKNVKSILEDAYKPESGSIIFIADSGYCDVAMLFPECIIKGYTTHHALGSDDEMWALGQIRLYAAGIRSEILSSDEVLSPDYIKDVDYAIWGTAYFSSYKDAEMLCQYMKDKSKMLIFMDKNDAAGAIDGDKHETLRLRKEMVEKSIIGSIKSFEEDDELLSIRRNKICILAYNYSHAMVHMQLTTGEEFDIPSEQLDHEILWPSYYAAKKPEAGIPLSSIVSFVDLGKRWDNEWDKDYFIQRKDGRYVLSEKVKNMPIAAPADMAADYKDANLCEANLKLAGDPLYEKWTGWIRRVEQPCILSYGNKEKFVVGYVKDMPDKGLATLDTIVYLIPKEGIDVRYVAALLLSPEIKEQIITISEGDVSDRTFALIMNKVIVPNHSDKEKLSFMAESNYNAMISSRKEMENNFSAKLDAEKTAYISEIRMRKHDMRPHMKQLNSAKNLMQYYVENMATTENVQDHLKQQLFRFQDALGHLSDIIAHLSDEEEFGEPERFPIVEHLQTLVSEYSRMGYTINFKYNVDDVKDFLNLKIDEFIKDILKDIREPEKAKKYESKEGEYSFPILWSYAFISPLDFDRMIQNIIENARKHGFTDPARSDYKLWINLSVDKKREMYQIDFMNNGTPLPEGMTKDRFGIRGEKAGITGGTGSGGYIIKSIVNHYGGDYDVFSKDGITTVRINLPIATI